MKEMDCWKQLQVLCSKERKCQSVASVHHSTEMLKNVENVP